MNSPLASFLRTRIPAGLHYAQAVQLFLHMFCRAGVVPSELAPLTSKEELANAYSELAAEGWIHASAPSTTEQPDRPATEPEHWRSIVKSFLLKQIGYVPEQGERLERLLR
jgi:hypothetical protein